jgi:hypothetical protein
MIGAGVLLWIWGATMYRRSARARLDQRARGS